MRNSTGTLGRAAMGFLKQNCGLEAGCSVEFHPSIAGIRLEPVEAVWVVQGTEEGMAAEEAIAQ